MKTIISDILADMRGSLDNIQEDARHKGYQGDVNDADATLDFLANYSMDNEDYALLYANSAVLEMGGGLVRRHGDDADKAEAARMAAFDYNA